MQALQAMSYGPVPWVVAEGVSLDVVTHRPRLVSVAPHDPRLHKALVAAIEELELDTTLVEHEGGPLVELLVWVVDPTRPTAGARQDLLAAAVRSRGDVIICEQVISGHGIGSGVLSEIDPQARTHQTDEFRDPELGIRPRKAWEPPARWIVARSAAWRFLSDAEMARAGFVRRLPRMPAAEMVMTCRRVLSRYDTAHELLLMSLQEVVRRGDREGINAVIRELALHPEAPRTITHRASALLAANHYESLADGLRLAG